MVDKRRSAIQIAQNVKRQKVPEVKSPDTKIIDNTYSILKKHRNVISNKILKSIKSQDPCNPEKVSKELVGKTPRKKTLGQGAYGIVRLIPVGDRKYVAVKTEKSSDDSLLHEYVMMKLLKKRDFLTPNPYTLKRCSFGNIMYYEYANKGSVDIFIDRLLASSKNRILVPFYLKAIITQLIFTVYDMQKKLKNFRHNDLHLGNVLISGYGKMKGYSRYRAEGINILRQNLGIMTYLHDFGFSNCDILEHKDVVKGIFKRGYGLAKDNHELYDIHFFLNALYHKYYKEPMFLGARKFIEDIFPKPYLQVNSPFVENYRLRYRKHYLPSYKRIFLNPYFKKKELTPVKDSIETLMPLVPQNKINKKIKEGEHFRIGKKRCYLYKKDELIKFAKDKKIKTDKMTKDALCKALEKKSTNKV